MRTIAADGSRRAPAGDRTHHWRATWDRGYTCTMCGRDVAAAHRTTGRCVQCTLEVER